MREYSRSELHWRPVGVEGFALHLGEKRLLRIVPDPVWRGMWRILFRDGHRSDIVNRSRVADAALSHALAELRPYDHQEMPLRAPARRSSTKNDPPPPDDKMVIRRAAP